MDDPSRALVRGPPAQLAKPLLDRRGLVILLWQVLTSVETTPLPPPSAPPDLADMPVLVRVYECLRLCLLDVEYALSPGGQLRGIGRWACRISVAVGILALGLAAMLACVSVVLAVVAIIVGQLVAILWGLLQAVLLLIALLVIGFLLLLAVRAATG
jgi:hypothetical protein